MGLRVGGAVSGQTVTLKHIDSHTVERIAYLAGKKLTTERWVISQDGKTRTVTQTGTNTQGQPVAGWLVERSEKCEVCLFVLTRAARVSAVLGNRLMP